MARIDDDPIFGKLVDASQLAILAQLSIRRVEQLAAVIANPFGAIAFGDVIGADLVRKLEDPAKEYILRNMGMTLASYGRPGVSAANGDPSFSSFRDKLGYISAEKFAFRQPVPDQSSFLAQEEEIERSKGSNGESAGITDESKLVFDKNEPVEVRDQGYRGTCVAFTVTNLLLIRAPQAQMLSPQYLYMQAKSRDGNPSTDGTTFQSAIEAAIEHGVCPEAALTYRADPDFGQKSIVQRPKITLTDLERKAGYCTVENQDAKVLLNGSCKNINALKAYLRRGLPVGLGVETFDIAWVGNGDTVRTGEVIMPPVTIVDGLAIMSDYPTGAHAITLVGFQDESDASGRPGGGYFHFLNSWGTSWANGNSKIGPGYGLIPYEYVRKYAVAACVIESAKINDSALAGKTSEK